MGDELSGLQLSGEDHLEQHGERDGVHEARRQRDVVRPESSHFQLDALSVNADVREVTARCHHLLADIEGQRRTDRFDRHIDALVGGQRHHFLDSLPIGAVHDAGRTERPRNLESVVVDVDHDALGWREELRGHQGCEPDRASSDHGDGIAGLHLAVEDAALEAGRQDVAQHDQRVLVSAGRHAVEAAVRMRNANILGLRAVD